VMGALVVAAVATMDWWVAERTESVFCRSWRERQARETTTAPAHRPGASSDASSLW